MTEKYYAVKKGLKTGIFKTWEECKESVNGYSGAVYKSFKTETEAKIFLDEIKPDMTFPDCVEIYVDGSYNSATGDFSYGMVVLDGEQTKTYSQSFHDAELSSMRNVAGEIKGAEAAMQYALDHGIPKIAIYHDYEGIAKWCLGLWKTNKEGTKAYKAFYEEAKKKIDIKFVKVTGHSGDTYNEMADRLAKEALGLL